MGVGEMSADIRADLDLEVRRVSPRLLTYLAAAAVVAIAAGSVWLARREPAGPDFRAAAATEDPAVRAALRAGRVPLPAFLGNLAPGREILMGGSLPAPAASLSPAATAVPGVAIRFRWTPTPGKWTYRVRIFTLDGNEVLAGPEVRDPEWTSGPGLAPGTDYQWQVEAASGDERRTIPEPPESAPRFRVLDASESNRLGELARRNPGAHLLLGVEYAKAGAVDDARAELTEALRQDPDRQDVRHLLESLKTPNR